MAYSCPLCRSERVPCVFVKEQIPYFLCRACHFRFARPATNANFPSTLDNFEEAYLQYLRPDPADNKNFAALCSWMSRFGPLADARLLDAGCGSGKWVRYLRQHAVNAHGLEPCTALYQAFLAGEAFFTHGSLADFCRQRGQAFDLVTAFDVLEHIEEPLPFLEQLAALLRRHGLLFLSTPDAGSLPATLLGKRWHFFCPYHLSYFSRLNLSRAAERFGLKVLHFSRRGRYRSTSYMWQYLFEFLLRRKAPGIGKRLARLYLPINLYDTMYLCFQKVAPATWPCLAKPTGV